MNIVTPQTKISTEKGITTLFLTNMRNNTVVLKALRWEEIKLPENWTLSQAIPSKSIKNIELEW